MSIAQQVTKVHATGNDFIIYADPEGEYAPTAQEVRAVCDRHCGIGADGVIRLTRPRWVQDLTQEERDAAELAGAQWFMDYRNADGSLAQMCGNGTRALSLFAMREGFITLKEGDAYRLATRAGVKTLTYRSALEPYGEQVFTVDMGAYSREALHAFRVTIPDDAAFNAEDRRGTFVDMGNPHVVCVINESDELYGGGKSGDDNKSGDGGVSDTASVADAVDAAADGSPVDLRALHVERKPVVTPSLESDQNVEFVRVDAMGALGCDEIQVKEAAKAKDLVQAQNMAQTQGYATMRVHERGSGETLSCGTGLCASGVVLRALYGIGEWDIRVDGGLLHVSVSSDDVRLTGSAVIIGRVSLDAEWLAHI